MDKGSVAITGLGIVFIGAASGGLYLWIDHSIHVAQVKAEHQALEEKVRQVRFIDGNEAGLESDTGYFIKNSNIVIVKTGNEYHVDFAAEQVSLGHMLSMSQPTPFENYPAEWIEQARTAGLQSAQGILDNKETLLKVEFPENAKYAKLKVDQAVGFIENHGTVINVDLTPDSP